MFGDRGDRDAAASVYVSGSGDRMPEAVAARVAALAGLAGDDEATVVLVCGGDEHGITAFHNTVAATR